MYFEVIYFKKILTQKVYVNHSILILNYINPNILLSLIILRIIKLNLSKLFNNVKKSSKL